MLRYAGLKLMTAVALLAEGVDRNMMQPLVSMVSAASPSSRRAWIEMPYLASWTSCASRRPPRGGRG